MGSRIPDPIRKRVLRQWFQGLSRNHIALENGPQFDIVRELAVMLKMEGNLDVNLFASVL
jgi:hypothetical protein